MFHYISNVNKRSKRIQLQFCAYRGLIITSPVQLGTKRLEKICFDNQEWIKTQQQKHPLQQAEALPNTLDLVALEKMLTLKFVLGEKNKTKENGLHLTIIAHSKEQQIIVLKRWIRKQAKRLLSKKLNEWSKNTHLHYSKLTVRSQKSRWGSCSSSGTISLNDQLLFMPLSVLDYIIVHELCHTVHPNHAPRYWALLEQHYPNFKQQERLLAQYVKKIPSWFRASLY